MQGGLMEVRGESYRLLKKEEREALVEYVYQCPYCKEKAVVQGYAYPADYERVEYGAFYDKLCCSLCGEVSEVHFSRDIKREVAGEE